VFRLESIAKSDEAGLKNKSYAERLDILNLMTLETGRQRKQDILLGRKIGLPILLFLQLLLTTMDYDVTCNDSISTCHVNSTFERVSFSTSCEKSETSMLWRNPVLIRSRMDSMTRFEIWSFEQLLSLQQVHQ